MEYFNRVRNLLKAKLDPEIAAIGRIIAAADSTEAAVQECNDVFIQRLKKNPGTLKLSFWENHFEWHTLKDYPEISGRILDFGCGSGHSDIFLARSGYEVHGVDLSSIGIAIADHLQSAESPEVRQRLSFSCADVVTGRPEKLFDAAWSSHVFEHISDPLPILNGLKNWLKPGACLLISVPLGRAYDDPGHVNHFADGAALVDFLGAAVTVSRVDYSPQFQVIRALCRF
jgi:2-polyprenyl-3-methyl-5-hydroxy-6-metoxy-1,4-benzoquinol methylase